MKIKNIYGEWVTFQILPHEYAALYREWFNDFLTIACFAEYIGFSEKRTIRILNKGRLIHNDIFGNT